MKKKEQIKFARKHILIPWYICVELKGLFKGTIGYINNLYRFYFKGGSNE